MKDSNESGKVIDGSVSAAADPSAVAVNDPTPAARFCVREVVHHSYECDPATGQERGRLSMIEYEIVQGTPPDKWSPFQGVGMLTANTPPKPHGMGTVRREYRFNIYADSVEDAWSRFAEYNQRGAIQAEDNFRREFTEWQQAQASRIALPDSAAGSGLVGVDGRPIGG